MSDIDESRQQAAAPPGIAAGIFFLLWAALGWYGVLTNAPLVATFRAPGLDPGPAILSAMACLALSGGGLWLLVTGLLARNPGHAPVTIRALALPALFLATALVVACLIGPFGFRLPALVFAVGWLTFLGKAQPVWWKRIALSLLLGAGIIGAIEIIFVQVLRVPLP